MKATKTWLSVLLALVLLLSCCSFAFAADVSPETTHGDVRATGACGAEGSDVNYILYSDGTLVISGRGKIMDGAFSGGDLIHLCIEASLVGEIRELVIGDGITTIGSGAFCFLQLRRIDFGNTVVCIGESAFYDTDGFEEVLLPDSVKVVEACAFGLCSNLKKIVFGRKVETVGDWTLLQCRALETVVFLNRDTEIIQEEKPEPIWGTYYEELNTIHCGTVYGYVGSTAEAYVAQHPILRFVPLDADGHVWSEGVQTRDPYCTTDGEITYYCTLCDETKTDPVPALGHAEPDSHGNCTRCGEHIKDVCPWCGGQHTGGFYQSIVGWLHNLLANLFGAKY